MAESDTRPLVSIIMPSFNQGAYIQDAIDSILEQDYRPIQILVIDGASTDKTVDILRSYGDLPELKWISEPDSGPVEAVNKGLSLATGTIAGIQSSDDLYYGGAVSAAVSAFQSGPDIGLVYGESDRIDPSGAVLARNRSGPYSLNRLLCRATYVPQNAAFFDIRRARELRGWDERFPFCPDTELWFKLALTSGVRKLDRALGATRVHPAQRDQNVGRILQSYRLMIRVSPELATARWIQRRAAAAGVRHLSIRYRDHKTHNGMVWELWRAVLEYPPILWSGAIEMHQLVPGYFRLAASLGRMKRLARWSS